MFFFHYFWEDFAIISKILFMKYKMSKTILFQVKSRTDVLGMGVSGDSRARTSWQDIIGSIQAQSRLSAPTVIEASPDRTTSLFTWRDISDLDSGLRKSKLFQMFFKTSAGCDLV